MTNILIAILFLLFLVTIYFLVKLNKYMSNVEKVIAKNLQVTQNLKQTLKEAMVDESFLLDDGTMKKMPYQKEKNVIYNGIKLDEEIKEF